MELDDPGYAKRINEVIEEELVTSEEYRWN